MTLTVPDPLLIIPGPPGIHEGKEQGADLQRTVAAGFPPILTVGFPSIIERGNPG